MTPEEFKIRQRLITDFEYYAPRCLSIRPKDGGLAQFALNSAQKYIHDKLEEQKARTGKVRAIILKGRQQGVSTYVEGRFYWLVSQSKGKQAFILTHQQQATDNLFAMVQRYHDYCPEVVKPKTSAASSKEIFFSVLQSGYKVGTAGSKNVGRSSTIQYFHGSEAALWPNADEHAAGIMNAISDSVGTESIIESTGYGTGNYFHKLWQSAVRGDTDYIPIFVSWTQQTEYYTEPPVDFELTDEEKELKQQYKLSDGQIYWRRRKIGDYPRNGEYLFRQEYPFTPDEAFQVGNDDSLINTKLIQKALDNEFDFNIGNEPIIIGVDPAGLGRDSTGISVRKGLKLIKCNLLKHLKPMEIVGHLSNLIQEYKPQKLFIDNGNMGTGIVNRLEELGYGDIVTGVWFGGQADDPIQYFNKRTEMWDRIRIWLEKSVSLPKSDEHINALTSQLVVPTYMHTSEGVGTLKLESKDSLKKRGFESPDLGDSLALTFAYTVRPTSDNYQYGNHLLRNKVNQGEI